MAKRYELKKAKSDSPPTPSPQTIEVRGITRKKLVDVVYVFDTTGSMASKIRPLQSACQFLVDEFDALNLDTQFGFVSFGDIYYPGSTDTIEVGTDITGNIEVVKSAIAAAPSNNGYGNTGESSFEALIRASQLSFRPKAVKALILITDEPALQHRYSPGKILQLMKQGEFMVSTITPKLDYFQQLAKLTGGEWLEISASPDMGKILEQFQSIGKKVAQTSSKVHRLGGGNVQEYLKLTSGDSSKE